MRYFAIVTLSLASLVSAKPALSVPALTYASPLIPGTQVSISRGQTLDRSKIAPDERRTNSANEAESLIESREQELPLLDSAPLGADGRVVDTPEVAAARAAHAAAHVNEKINLANEAARSSGASDSSESNVGVIHTETVIGPDGRILNRPEVRTAHDEKINLEVARSSNALAQLVDGPVVPLVLGNGVVAALVPIGSDTRPLNVPETIVARSGQNPANVRGSVDALAIAGPALAYGRLIY